MKHLYRLTDEELEAILKASQPVVYIIIGGHEPDSPQENANRAWKVVAKAHGFIWDTVESAHTGDQHDVLAEPIPPVEPVVEAIQSKLQGKEGA